MGVLERGTATEKRPECGAAMEKRYSERGAGIDKTTAYNHTGARSGDAK